jgi:hypothetical protein
MPKTKKPRPRASMTTSHMKMLLVALVPVRNFCAFAGEGIAMDQFADRLATPASHQWAVKCHSEHRFSRRRHR